MGKYNFKLDKYSIRKFKVGACSTLIGMGLIFVGGETVSAQETQQDVSSYVVTNTKSELPETQTIEHNVEKEPLNEQQNTISKQEIENTNEKQTGTIENETVVDSTSDINESTEKQETVYTNRNLELPTVQPAQVQPANLLQNGDFEQTEASSGNWYYAAATGWDNPYIPKGTKKSNGTVYAYDGKLTIDAQKTYRAIVSQWALVDNTKRYLLSGDLQTFNVQGSGARVRVTYTDEQGKSLTPPMVVLTDAITGSVSTHFEKVLTMTPETVYLKIELMFDKGTGAASFDNISLTEYQAEQSTFNKEKKEVENQIVAINDNKIYVTNRVDLRYEVENQEIAQVDNYLIVPKSAGTTKVFVYDGNTLVSQFDFTVNPYQKNVFDTMIDSWENISISNSQYNDSDPNMKRLKMALEKQVEDALNDWHDPIRLEPSLFNKYTMDKSADITSNYRHLETMAKVVINPSSKYYRNRDLVDKVKGGLQWLYEHVYNENKEINGNWWDYEIGTPLSLLNTLSYMNAYFTQDEINMYLKPVRKFVPDTTMIRMTTPKPVPAVGGNQTDISKVAILEGALSKDDKRVRDGVYGLTTIMDYINQGEGFYRDGSFIDHTNVAYTGAYGNVLIDGFSQILPVIQSTEFALPEDKTAIIQGWIDKAFMPILVKGELLDMTRGRSISRPYVQSHVYAVDIIAALARIAQTANKQDKEKLQSFVKEQVQSDTFSNIFEHVKSYKDAVLLNDILKDDTIKPRQRENYIAAFNNMDKFVYHNATNDFSFGISMYSNKTQNYEDMNNENRHGWYTADGMVYLYNGDLSHYSNNYWPTVDPYRLPGTTTTTTIREDGSGETVLPSGFVGINQLGEQLASVAMDFTNWNKMLSEKKAWFILKDKIVFLGTNLQNQSNDSAITTIENRKLVDGKQYSYYVDGKPIQLDNNLQSLDNAKTFYMSNGESNQSIGYVFLSPTSLKAQVETREGKWSDINYTQPKDVHTNQFMTLQTGKRLNGSNYAYVLAPNSSMEQLDNIYKNVQVLTQTDSVQAVYDNGEKTWGVVKYDDSLYQLNDDITLTKQGIYTIMQTDNGYTVSYYNPIDQVNQDVATFQTNGLVSLQKKATAEYASSIWNVLTPQTQKSEELSYNLPSLEITTEDIAFNTRTQQDTNLPKGQREVLQEGKMGTAKVAYEVAHDGSRKQVSYTVVTEAVDEIVVEGTKQEATTVPSTKTDKSQNNTSDYQKSSKVTDNGKKSDRKEVTLLPKTGETSETSAMLLGFLSFVGVTYCLSMKKD